ncbi:MAG: hypothetical protein M3Y07_00275 [Acidobacteriota bacterium]|nr:hypothetical protein [Acidobacteriota bacterium]
MTTRSEVEKRIAAGQGVPNLASGLWPVFNRKSFEAVTGPKADFWLVKTVGLLIATTGAALIIANRGRSVGTEMKMVGAGTAASLAGVDWYYGGKGRISRIYLLDALVQGGIAALWIAAGAGKIGSPEPPRVRHQ